MRLDYALVNDRLNFLLPTLTCHVAHDNVTTTLSDHFPIVCEAVL
jgi:endonuclease/exonuclease/phosphatase family metal-dependent hydrolase